MGIFKLTLLTTGVLGVAMMQFGSEDGLPADRIGREPSIAQETIVPVSAKLDIQTAAKPTISSDSSDSYAAILKASMPSKTAPTNTGPNAADRAVAAAIEMARAPRAKIVAAAALPVLSVDAKAVNLRRGPSTANSVVARLTRGMTVEQLSQTDTGWSEIRVLETGATGFMATRFLSQ